MPAPREPQLLDHEYDGISEYDNPTPGWWHAFFIGSVFFSVLYLAFWHSSPVSWTVHDQLASDEQAYYGLLFRDLGELQPDEPTMLRMMADQKWMAFGASVFRANCSQCHKADGTGETGANLTDDQWINVKTLTDVYAVVSEGVAAKGMPTWKNRLGQNERILVASYVASLRANPKPGRTPEGTVIPPWPTAQPAQASPQLSIAR
jgi:cytochrome c oxidase cbb3-type subunit 3